MSCPILPLNEEMNTIAEFETAHNARVLLLENTREAEDMSGRVPDAIFASLRPKETVDEI